MQPARGGSAKRPSLAFLRGATRHEGQYWVTALQSRTKFRPHARALPRQARLGTPTVCRTRTIRNSRSAHLAGSRSTWPDPREPGKPPARGSPGAERREARSARDVSRSRTTPGAARCSSGQKGWRASGGSAGDELRKAGERPRRLQARAPQLPRRPGPHDVGYGPSMASASLLVLESPTGLPGPSLAARAQRRAHGSVLLGDAYANRNPRTLARLATARPSSPRTGRLSRLSRGLR